MGVFIGVVAFLAVMALCFYVYVLGWQELLSEWRKPAATREDVLELFGPDDEIKTMQIMDTLRERGMKCSHGRLYTILRRLEEGKELESWSSSFISSEEWQARGERQVRIYRRVKPIEVPEPSGLEES